MIEPALTVVVEWLGALLGVAGSLMMSLNRAASKYAWYPWIASNALLMAYGVRAGAWGIFAMQAVFLLINLNGLWQWHVRHVREARRASRTRRPS